MATKTVYLTGVDSTGNRTLVPVSFDDSGTALVSVTNPGEIITDQNQYWVWHTESGPTNKANIQLLNPTGSGKNLLLTGLYVQLSATDEIHIREYGETTGFADSGNAPQNTYIGGTASVVDFIRRTDSASAYGTFKFALQPIAAQGFYNLMSDGGMVITPGNGLVLRNNTATNSLIAGFYWVEIDA